MTDTIFIFEDVFAQPGQTSADDGSGNDWLIITGTYSFAGNPLEFGAEIRLGATQTLGFAYQRDGNGDVFTPVCNVFGQIENAQGGGGNELLQGGIGNNSLAGDPLGVAGGTDILKGFGGDDQLIGGGASDSLLGGWGQDLLLGDGDPNTDPDAFGMIMGDDTLFGGDGNDTLNGGGGTNVLDGERNYDLVDYGYIFDDQDNLTFHAVINLKTGVATVTATDVFGDSFVFAQDTLLNIEAVRGTSGGDEITGRGRTVGTQANSRDLLIGGDGADSIKGQAGADTLVGGHGVDVMTGGGGADLFAFAVLDTGVALAADRITDFQSGTDKIDLHQIAGGQVFILGDPFDGLAGQIRYDIRTGLLQADTDGNGAANYELRLRPGLDLQFDDLIL